MLSYDFWQNRLGGRGDVVGRTVRVNNHPMTVVGVAARGFRGMDWGEVPVALGADHDEEGGLASSTGSTTAAAGGCTCSAG